MKLHYLVLALLLLYKLLEEGEEVMAPLVVDTLVDLVVLVEELVEEITKQVILEKELELSTLQQEVLLLDLVMMVEMVKLVVAAEAAVEPKLSVKQVTQPKGVLEAVDLLLFLGFLQLFLVENMVPIVTVSGVAAEAVEDLIMRLVPPHVAQEQELQVTHKVIVDLEVVELGALILHAKVGKEAKEFVLLDI